eukprot:575774_1
MTELQLDIIPSSKPEVRNQKSIDEFDSHPQTQTLTLSKADSHTFPRLFSIGNSMSFKALPTMKDIKDLFQAPNHIKTAATLQTDSFYHIDPNKHCQIFRGYVRQDWDTINVEHGSEELRAGWIDILFDLIFVACVVHLATEAVYSIPSDDAHRRLASSTTVQHAEAHEDGEECHPGPYDVVWTCFAQFGLLSLFWMEQTMIDTHFVFNQQMDEIVELIYMIFVLSTGLFIRDDPLYHAAFQVSYACLRFISTLIYLKAFLIPRARLHSLWNITINCIVIIALIISAVRFRGCPIDYALMYTLFFLFEYASFIIHWCITNKQGHLVFALALHVAHISERFGLFVMLILGEAIISITTSDVYGSFSYQGVFHIVFVIATFVMTFCIAKLYFDCQPTEEAVMHGTHNHALRTTIGARILYIVSHHVLFFGLLGFGIGAKIAFKHLDIGQSHRAAIDLLLPGYSLVLIVISLNVIRASHPDQVASPLVWGLRILLILLMAITPVVTLVYHLDHWILFLIMFLSVIFLNLVDVEGRKERNTIKRELKEKRHQEKKKAEHQGTKNVRGQNLADLNLHLGVCPLPLDVSTDYVNRIQPK